MKKIILLIFYTFIFSTCLMGCSLFGAVKTPKISTYLLNSIPCPPTIKPPTRPITLMVATPQASAVYNTTQMAYTKECYELAYFAKNAWADTPPNMLQVLMVQTLQNTRHFKAVLSSGSTVTPDYVINTELLEIQQDFTHFPTIVRIRAHVQIVNAGTNTIVAHKQFAVCECADGSPCGGVIAANQATRKLLRQIEGFVLSKL